MNPALLSSVKMDWATPENVLELVRQVGPICFDPCTVDSNPTRAERWRTQETDGLAVAWWPYSDRGVTFVNPPYGRELPKWVAKCTQERRKFALMTTGTRYGHAKLEPRLNDLHEAMRIDVVITGDATGVDTQTVLWAIDNGVFFVSVGAEWDKYGGKAGPLRNGEEVKLLLAYKQAGYKVGCAGFPDSWSRGTHNALRQAREAGVATSEWP